MSNFTPSSPAPRAPNPVRSGVGAPLDASVSDATQSDSAMTPSQAEMLGVLEGRPQNSAPRKPGTHSSVRGESEMVFAVLGGLCVAAGLTAMFFLMVLGVPLLAVGGVLCYLAYRDSAQGAPKVAQEGGKRSSAPKTSELN